MSDPDFLPTDKTLLDGFDGFEHRRAIAQARMRLFGGAPLAIGRYRIDRRIGSGSMGEVYLAHDEELDRKVAIKRVLTSDGSERRQTRLRREARALAKLSHPNVVQVYEVGEHEQRTFLAMEYVDGETLTTWLSVPRPWRAVLECFLAAGRGLAAAHEAGIIHRDFKPDNVLIGHDGGVRVADFGLALADASERAGPIDHEQHDAQLSTPRMSVTGSIAGTVRYMALEQLLGRTVDARSDQFSFCLALYEALWGESPFTITSLAARRLELETGEPRQPARSRVPRGLWPVIRRGLARAPEQRWPDMATLLAALERQPRRRRWTIASLLVVPSLALLLGGRVLAEQREQAATIAACEAEGRSFEADWNDELRRELRRALAATGLAFASTSWALTEQRMDQYAGEWTALREQACLATELEHTRSERSRQQVDECLDHARVTFVELTRLLRVADKAMAINVGAAVAGLPVLTMCSDDAWLDARVQVNADIRAQVAALRSRLDRVRALRLAAQFDRGLAEASLVLTEARALGWRPFIAEVEVAVGELRDRVGEHQAARATLHRAFLDATASGNDFIALRACIALTLVESTKLSRPDAGLEWAALALVLIERLNLQHGMHEASALYALARAQRAKDEPGLALATHRRVLALDEAVHGPSHPDNAISLNAIGSLLFGQGRLDEAQAAHEQAWAIQEQTLGREHPDVANTLASLAKIAAARGQTDRALELVREALELEQAALGPAHLDIADTLDLLAKLRVPAADLDAGARAELLALRQRALAIREPQLGREHPALGWSRIRLAEALTMSGQLVLALEQFELAQAIFAAANPPDEPGVAAARTGRDEARLQLGSVVQQQPP
jgi:tetratricopeptide (TPR) repeat protein/predicted Ser/Thr protein kinase